MPEPRLPPTVKTCGGQMHSHNRRPFSLTKERRRNDADKMSRIRFSQVARRGLVQLYRCRQAMRMRHVGRFHAVCELAFSMLSLGLRDVNQQQEQRRMDQPMSQITPEMRSDLWSINQTQRHNDSRGRISIESCCLWENIHREQVYFSAGSIRNLISG